MTEVSCDFSQYKKDGKRLKSGCDCKTFGILFISGKLKLRGVLQMETLAACFVDSQLDSTSYGVVWFGCRLSTRHQPCTSSITQSSSAFLYVYRPYWPVMSQIYILYLPIIRAVAKALFKSGVTGVLSSDYIDRRFPLQLAATILTAGLLCIWINYDADLQRQQFRKTDGKEKVWGKYPNKVNYSYQLSYWCWCRHTISSNTNLMPHKSIIKYLCNISLTLTGAGMVSSNTILTLIGVHSRTK